MSQITVALVASLRSDNMWDRVIAAYAIWPSTSFVSSEAYSRHRVKSQGSSLSACEIRRFMPGRG